MSELKRKVVLKQKGEEAFVPIKQLMVRLTWSAKVDLDLMAFYRTKDGRTGGTVSDGYPGGTRGSLNSFPFMELDKDDLGDDSDGDSEEVIRITKLDEMAEVYLCTLNYTDAIEGRLSAFSQYDGRVEVIDDRGETVVVPLDSPDQNHFAVIARIDNTSPSGAKLINENRIISLAEMADTIPGADVILK